MNTETEEQEVTRIINSIVQGADSDYLIIKNQERCRAILQQKTKKSGDLIDAFIYLHIVLEAGLNGFFRNISLPSIKKGIDEFEITDNLDSISFIDKSVLFIYNSSFDFKTELNKAEEYHSIIKRLKQFANVRNMLLHGHSIKMINKAGVKNYSKLSQKLTEDELNKQVGQFRYILEGLQFYFKHLDSPLSKDEKKQIIGRFLDYSWIE